MNKKNFNYSKAQLTWLVFLRIAIGWHFLYEGYIKIINPNWSSVGYLLDSKGCMSGMFNAIASNPSILKTIDFMNEWGLLLVGLGLILGVFSRVAIISGMVLLASYYLSHPPFIGAEYALPSEGSYLFINKTLIEFIALGVLFLFPTSVFIGLDRLYVSKLKKQKNG